MNHNPIIYQVNQQIQLIIPAEILEKLAHFQQTSGNDTEAGGQLFAEITRSDIIIREITLPSKFDRRSRFSFIPNRLIQNLEILRFYKKSLHYIGDWHSHPELVPSPSQTDIETVKTSFLKSKHKLKWFLMIIIGTEKFPTGLYAAAVDNSDLKLLTPLGV